MAKFCGKIGFADSQERETEPGVWDDVIIEKTYYGDVIRNLRKNEPGIGPNDNININNSISVIGDSYIFKQFSAIIYIEWMGSLWKVTSVDVQRPRLILTIGGVYNGERPNETSETS